MRSFYYHSKFDSNQIQQQDKILEIFKVLKANKYKDKIKLKALYNCKLNSNPCTEAQFAKLLANSKKTSLDPKSVLQIQLMIRLYDQNLLRKRIGVKDLEKIRVSFGRLSSFRLTRFPYRNYRGVVYVGKSKAKWTVTSPDETRDRFANLFRKRSLKNPILESIVLYFRFLDIHPFDDGNGRVARIYLNQLLYKQANAPIHKINFEAQLFRRQKYYKLNLFREMDQKKSLKLGIDFMLQIILAAAMEAECQ